MRLETGPLDNVLHFQKNQMEEIQRVIMKIDQKIKYEKLEYDINSAAAKIFAKISGTTKHEIFEILSGSYSASDIQKYLE